MRVGVLALQGGYRPHLAMLARLGHEPLEVRSPDELEDADGVVLSGGESTAQEKLLEDAELLGSVRLALAQKPALVTCAGLVLAARWGLVDVEVARNAWGSQVASFEATSDGGRPMVFIRAPRFVRIGPWVEVLDTLAGEAIRVRSRSLVATTDHPELTSDRSIHEAAFGVVQIGCRRGRCAMDLSGGP